MLTREQVASGRHFHYGKCTLTIGPRGGETRKTEEWRANGMLKTWKTRPNEF